MTDQVEIPDTTAAIAVRFMSIGLLHRRSAADRLELRKAALALHLAELREGVWIRPDNLDPQRLSTPRAVLDQQCTHFHGAATDITADKMRSLFSLDGWADDARALIEAMNVTLTMSKRDDSTESFTTSSHYRSPLSGIFSSTRCCPSSSFQTTCRGTRCVAPIAVSTTHSNDE